MTDHAIQFHCMICYEEFENTPLRYPVVLPCGHTFVCRGCSDKLEKCMECREPLSIIVESTGGDGKKEMQSALGQSRMLPAPTPRVGRYGSAAVPHYATPSRQPAPKPVKKRLPMPKNIVLLSLIEATTLMISDAESTHAGETNSGDSSVLEQQLVAPLRDRSGSIDTAPLSPQHSHDSAVDEEHKRMAASVSMGIAGTYAVCCKEGLPILPTKPKGATQSSTVDEDVESLVHLFHMEKMKDAHQILHGSIADPEAIVGPVVATLALGDRIQVVSMEGGWAKLARGYGFVRAEKNEIVKVGNAVDKCCMLEAMLRTLSIRRRELRHKQGEVDTQFIKLTKHLQASLQNDEDLTVICRTAFGDEENTEVGLEVTETDSLASFTEKKEEEENPVRGGKALSGRFNSNGTSALTQIQGNVVGGSASAMYAPRTIFTPGISSPSPSEMKAGAQAWRERQAQEKEVNFRSGFSGHMALTVRAPNEFGGVDATSFSSHQNTRVTSFRMSTHTGLTMSHRKKDNRNPNRPSRSSVQDHIKLTGSM